jgi:hypothetical protein
MNSICLLRVSTFGSMMGLQHHDERPCWESTEPVDLSQCVEASSLRTSPWRRL